MGTVTTYGSLREMMHEGKKGPVFRVGDVAGTSFAYGIGALSDLRGEVTVLEGEVWLAYPEAGKARVVSGTTTDERAALFVTAMVLDWKTIPVEEPVEPAKLDDFIEKTAKANGVDTSEPFAVRIEGPAAVEYQVVDGSKLGPDASHEDHVRTAVTGAVVGSGVRLVGFYGEKAQGVFTHMGQRTQFHVVAPGSKQTGHADSIRLERGAKLMLPSSR